MRINPNSATTNDKTQRIPFVPETFTSAKLRLRMEREIATKQQEFSISKNKIREKRKRNAGDGKSKSNANFRRKKSLKLAEKGNDDATMCVRAGDRSA